MFNLNIGGELTIMVSLNKVQMRPQLLSATIVFPTPKPIILFTDKGLKEWEELFREMMDNSSDISEKHDYDQCYSALKWARFCNATSLDLRIGKSLDGHTVEINFFFSCYKHLSLFFNEVEKVLEAITLY